MMPQRDFMRRDRDAHQRRASDERRAVNLAGPVTITVQRPGPGTVATPAGQLATATTSSPTSQSTSSTTSASAQVTSPAAPPPPSSNSTSSASSDGSKDGVPDPKGLFKAVPGGTIAAIVIAVVLAIVIICVYIYRRKSLKSRRNKTRSLGGAIFNNFTAGGEGMQQRSPLPIAAQFSSQPTTPNPGFNAADYSNAQAYALRNGLVAMAPPSPNTGLRAPPASYNNPGMEPTVAGLQVALGTAVGIGMTMGTASPLKAPSRPNTAGSIQDTALVQCTFIPTLPDELSISTGETIQVLAEYDDGWAFCANLRGEQGMIPLECLGRGSASKESIGQRMSESGRRASSLASVRA